MSAWNWVHEKMLSSYPCAVLNEKHYAPPPEINTNKFAWVKFQNMIDACCRWFAIIEFII